MPSGSFPLFAARSHCLRNFLHGMAALDPFRESAGQRAHALDAATVQSERRTGARGFVWSSAVKDDVAVARYLLVPVLQFTGSHHQRARQFRTRSLDVQRIAQVHDHDAFAGVELL